MTLALQAADATPLVDVVVDMLELGSATRIVVDSLSKAALYVTIAAGLSLVFGLMGVLNFAHGSFAMYGAYLGGYRRSDDPPSESDDATGGTPA